MTKKEVVIAVLKAHDCLTGGQIKEFAKRLYGEDISKQTAAGILRPFVADGWVRKYPDPTSGKMVYWFTEIGKKVIS